MDKRELTCIGCPMGCALTVKLNEREVVSVEGNTCKRGDIYARKEVTAPARIVTSTVRIDGGEQAVAPVKTEKDIPKEKIFEVVQAIKKVQIEAPVEIGDVIIQDVCGTGVKIIVTKAVKKLKI